MTDTPTSDTPAPNQPEQSDTTPTRHNQPDDTPTGTTMKTGRTQNPTSDNPSSESITSHIETASPAAHVPTGKPESGKLSVSTNAALSFVGVLVTLFGSAIIGLLLYTLNNLDDRMDDMDGQLAELSQRQTDMDETLSVLVAILNTRNEVEAAKAHQIQTSPP